MTNIFSDNSILRKPLLLLGLMAILMGLSSTAKASHVLVFFDLSSSTTDARKDYFADFVKLPLKPGDNVILLPMGVGTNNYSPFINIKLPTPDPALSPNKNKAIYDETRMQILSGLKNKLNNGKLNGSSILPAFVTANDYFSQNQVAPDDRLVYIFSDMIEHSPDSGISMNKKIPESIPTTIHLPTSLNASINMIGVTINARDEQKLRSFWDQVVTKTSSSLNIYRQRY